MENKPAPSAPAEQPRQLLTPQGHAVMLALCGAWFVFFAILLRPWVPSWDEPYVTFFAVSTAGCLTGVFFIASNMFRFVLADERARKQAAVKVRAE